jgi:hypothetical protein
MRETQNNKAESRSLIRAASVLAAVPTANQPAPDRAAFDRAAAEIHCGTALQRRSTRSPLHAWIGIGCRRERIRYWPIALRTPCQI